MSPITFGLQIGFAGFVVFVLCHVVLLQLFKFQDRLKYFNRLFLIFFATITLVGANLNSQFDFAKFNQTDSLTVILFVIFVFYFFLLALYAILDHSVRTRLVIEMNLKNGEPLYKAEVFKIYDPNLATSKRLEQLKVAGYLETDRRGYRLSSKGLLFAKISYYGKLFYKVGLGG